MEITVLTRIIIKEDKEYDYGQIPKGVAQTSFCCWFLSKGSPGKEGWFNYWAFVLLSGVCTFRIKAERHGTVR